MSEDVPKRDARYFLIPIFGVVFAVFLIGFTYTIYIATEYGRHSQELRIIDSIGKLTSMFRRHHSLLFADHRKPNEMVQLERDDGSVLSNLIDALVVDMGKVVVAVSYSGTKQAFYKGHTEQEARRLAGLLETGDLETILDSYQGESRLVETAIFSSDPVGRLSIAATAKPSKFVVDFVFFKVWPVLLFSIVASITIAATAYEFVRSRYNEVEAERLRFNDFAESSSDWFWEMDENLRFSYFSSRFTEVTGVPQSVLLGVTREENGNPGATEEDWEQHLRNLHSRRPFRNFVHPRTKPDGSVVWLSINGKPVFQNDRFLGFRGTGTDITRHRAAEEQLKDLKEKAEHADRAKTEFLANMSHELRTPLNAIVGFSDALARGTFGPIDDPQIQGSIKSIYDAGNHLTQIISDILDISKIEASVMALDEEEVNLVGVVSDAVSLLLPSAQDQEIELLTEFPEDLPSILGDRLRIKQVSLNLLNNALKFTPSGGRVVVSLELQNHNGISMRVSDSGIGIKREDISKIVEPFGQVANTQSRNHGGTGLGLPICKALIELHGGYMEIESEIGQGTTVVVEFPSERTIDRRQV